jgi:hypothetical protein
MAKRDKITFAAGGGRTITETCVNLTFSIGVGGDNGPADVMLFQTLINYIAAGTRAHASPLVGLTKRDLPAITGRMDAKTQAAIYAFQRTHQQRLLSVDGKIESAKYEGRVISNFGGRVMTITWLDQKARDEALMRNDVDHIAALIRLEPRLRPWLS